MDTFRAGTDGLNLRRAPEVVHGNIITPLTLGHPVQRLDGDPGDRFWRVQATVDGQTHTGFAASRFLRKPVSDARETLMEHAVTQWMRFNRGGGLEHTSPFFKFIGEFWKALDPGSQLDGRNRDHFWSAAFISFIVRKAGYQGFKFSEAHATYIHDAIKKRKANDASAPFWGFRLTEHRPQLGDLVAGWRKIPRTFDNLPQGFFPSHTDVVVEVRPGEIRTLGGNVAQSVSMKMMQLDGNGFLVGMQPFAVLRNNL